VRDVSRVNPPMATPARAFRALISGPEPHVAPSVSSPMSARLAERAGFKSLYLGGGPLGYVNFYTEATIALPEMVQAGIDIRAACTLPLVLDGTAGWGDPMHLRRTVNLSEAAGFAGIEIEDQVLPKRAHHHVGVEHAVPMDLMAAKIREAVAVRRDPDFVIIGRTNEIRRGRRDEAVRRAEAYREAGADMLFVLAPTPEDMRFVGERLPPPLMQMSLGGGVEAMGLTRREFHDLGFRYLVDPMTAVLAMHKALRLAYDAMARGETDPTLGPDGAAGEQERMHETIGLEAMLAVERATVETGEED
jgi:2-methylisocitrate lyase-like PEP mutase family enzyme